MIETAELQTTGESSVPATTTTTTDEKASTLVNDSDDDDNNSDDDDDDVFTRFATLCGTSSSTTKSKPKIKIILKSHTKTNPRTTIRLASSRSQRNPKRSSADDTTTAVSALDVNKIPHSSADTTSACDEIVSPSRRKYNNLTDDDDDNDSSSYRDTYYDNEDDLYSFDQSSSVAAEIEECFKFLEETHEEQDPQWIKYQNNKIRDQIQKQIKEIDLLDIQQRKEIDVIVKQQMSEKQNQIEMTLEKFKVRLNQERSNRIGRIEQWYRQKTASDNQKVSDGVKIFQSRHQKEIQLAMQQHRHWQQQQQQQQRMMLGDAEWQQTMNQLQQKHQRDIEDFKAKGEVAQAKTESDYRRERDKVRQELESKLAEIEANKSKLLQRQQAAAQLSRQRCLRRQLLKVMQQRKILFNKLAEVAPKNNSDHTGRKSTSDHSTRRGSNDEMQHSRLLTLSPSVTSPRKLIKLLNLDTVGNDRIHFDGTDRKAGTTSSFSTTDNSDNDPLGPMKSRPDWLLECIRYCNEYDNEHTQDCDELGLMVDDNIINKRTDTTWDLSGAPIRVQHRRAIMSTAVRQVTVEIHNEGILVSIINSDSKDDDKRDSNSKNNDKLSNDSDNRNLVSGSSSLSSESSREFISWGVKAFTFLESVVCGEIPMGYKRLFDRLSKESIAYHGGQIRCVLLDLRTSHESASIERGKSLQEYEESYLQDLIKREAEMTRFAYDAEKVAIAAEARIKEQWKIIESCQRDVDCAKHIQDEFRVKFRTCLDPGTFIISFTVAKKNVSGLDQSKIT
jgi:hypothetical protein